MPTSSTIINACDIGIIILNQDYRVKNWNNWLTEYTGVTESWAKNKTLQEIFGDRISPRLMAAIDNTINNKQSTYLSPRLHKHPLPIYRESRNKTGKELIHQKIVISYIEDQDKKHNCIINITDVTASIQRERALQEKTSKLTKLTKELKESEKAIKKIAFHDSLTGLANRSLFLDRLDMFMAQSRRQNNLMSVMLIDIDFFKDINDNYGHDIGDAVLIEVSNRLKSCVRESDTVARLGGDEFAIIQTQLDNKEGSETLARKICDIISRPIVVYEELIKSSVSIGISVFPNDANNYKELLKNADLALYKTKHEGRAGWYFYEEYMRKEQKRKKSQYESLRTAINDDKIIVHYQPQICLSRKQLDSVEALVRYKDDDNQIVMPNKFISIAEESGLINDITESMLQTICESASSWKQHDSPKIAINLSSIQFRDDDLIYKIAEAHEFLKRNNVSLEVEITESILMENTAFAVETLNKISEKGISIALDDFGTGYSSLGYLKDFPVSKLKIDRSFISGIASKEDKDIITNTIISLGHNLGMKVVAEGVEKNSQHDYLIDCKCDSAQGFFYSKPVDIKEINNTLNNQTAA